MALIKCPECGKEKVSDSAPTCPECGFAVREHFEDIVKSRLEKERAIQAKKYAEQEKQREVENLKQQELCKLASITIPDKPQFSILSAISGMIFAVIGALSAITSDDFDVRRSVSHGNGDPRFMGIFLVLFGLAVLGYGYFLYSKERSKYNLALSNFEEYREQKVKEDDELQAQRDFERQIAASRITPTCPSCRSTNVKSISTTSRLVSVGMVGLASSKIGKAMECKNCGYKW